MFKLLLEHCAIGKACQHVVEGKLGDPLLALDDLPDHFVEAFRKAGKLVFAANAHLDMFSRRKAASSLVVTLLRLRNSSSLPPCGKADEQMPEQSHDSRLPLKI